MKISKRQASFGSILVVALGALAYDLSASSGPAGAVAAPPGAAVPVAGTALGGSSIAEPAEDSDITYAIANRLRALGAATSTRRVRDAFGVPAAWTAAPPAAAVAAVEDTRAKRFRDQHHLKALFAQGTAGMALVDERLLQVGQRFDGYVLVGIDDRTARFASPGASATLVLEDGGTDGQTGPAQDGSGNP